MKKLLFKIIALCLVVCSTVALFTACGAPVVKDTRETIELGLYPQTQVTDENLIKALEAQAGDPEYDFVGNWVDYGYYNRDKASGCMYYTDQVINNVKYRGVYIKVNRTYMWCDFNYNPNLPLDEVENSPYYRPNKGNSWQDNNDFERAGVYWFKYEPIVWTVVKEEGGFKTLVSNVILDSQPFQTTFSGNPKEKLDGCYNNNGVNDSAFANNYEYSTIRTWLNDMFYNLAFSASDMAKIQTVSLDNSSASTGYENNAYACANTQDKVFLLSYKEAKEYFNSDALRAKKTTGYAQCNNAYTFGLGLSNDGNGSWWLRSPDSKTSFQSRVVRTDGILVDTASITVDAKDKFPSSYVVVALTQFGVVPAIKIVA